LGEVKNVCIILWGIYSGHCVPNYLPRVGEDMTETFWITFFLDMVYSISKNAI